MAHAAKLKQKKDSHKNGQRASKGAALSRKEYEKELRRMQVELVQLEEWVRHRGLRVVVLFEGRDAAGKGGAIKRITESLNPRICRVVALGTPTEREKTQWFSSVMLPIFPRAARSFYSTGAGTTGPASNMSWDSAV